MKRIAPPRPTGQTLRHPPCDHCKKPCKNGTVRNADGVFCKPTHARAARALRQAAAEPIEAEVVEPVDVSEAIASATKAIALRSADQVSIPLPPLTTERAQRTIMQRWFSGKSEDTIRNYTYSLKKFAKWCCARYELGLDTESPQGLTTIVKWFVAHPPEIATMIAQEWVTSMTDDGNTASSVGARLAALSSICGAMNCESHVAKVKPPRRVKRSAMDAMARYAGVPEAFVNIMTQMDKLVAHADASPVDVRDWAMFRVGSGCGFRRIELVRLDLNDVNFSSKVIEVHGKGRKEREPFPLPDGLVPVLKRWINVRSKYTPRTEKALFVCQNVWHMDGEPRKEAHRMTRAAFDAIVMRRAAAFGEKLNTHDLRRIFCTDTLDDLGPRDAIPLTRHRNVDTVMVYDLAVGKKMAADATKIERRISKKRSKRGAR